jgi:hypothetical protein
VTLDLVRRRLTSQQLVATPFTEPADVVQWLVAVQAQDYAGAKWALGLRATGTTDDDVERAFAAGLILRTHVLRPTWHFVAPSDIRWLLALTAPRVRAASAYMHRKLGLGKAEFARSDRALTHALRDGQSLTRGELRDLLAKSGIETHAKLHLGYLLMHAELEGIVCSGPRRGRQFTYALLDDRVSSTRVMERDEALAELAHRYFVSRGPATVHDMAKWSGLTLADVRRGLDGARSRLVHEVIGEQTFWLSPSKMGRRTTTTPTVHLLSIYDEYVSAYKNRSAMVSEETRTRLSTLGNALTHIVVIDGLVTGTWKPRVERRSVAMTVDIFRRLKRAES